MKINKIFNNETIRTIWDKEEGKYYISIVDIVVVISESDRPRKYWSDLKSKLKQEGNEVSEKIGQLKLKSQDGKYYNTDVTDIEGMFRIIESIPSKNAEPVKLWLVKLGKERIDEVKEIEKIYLKVEKLEVFGIVKKKTIILGLLML